MLSIVIDHDFFLKLTKQKKIRISTNFSIFQFFIFFYFEFSSIKRSICTKKKRCEDLISHSSDRFHLIKKILND